MQEKAKRGPVEIPRIGAPFPLEAGPYAEEAQSRHMQWAERHEVFRSKAERQRFAAMDIGSLVSLLYPAASGPEDVALVADWCAWLLLRDDRWDATDSPEEWERLAAADRAYLRLMRGSQRGPGQHGREGLYGALADLCARLRERARREGLPDPVDRRLVAVMKGFFNASVRQAAHQRRRECPDLAEYVRMRSVTGGLDILTFVLAALDGVRLPEALFTDDRVRRLTAASHNVCCWHNDLVSLNKELQSGEVHNLILVLLEDPEVGCRSLSQAVAEAVRMIYEEIELFCDLKVQLEREVGQLGESRREEEPFERAARWYAGMLRERVGGVIVWHESCAARYQQGYHQAEHETLAQRSRSQDLR